MTDPGSNPVTFRTHRPGDLGYIIHRHGAAYAQEYDWDEHFEATVARIAADFIDNYDPVLERCWIAERDGLFMGCVCLVKDAKRVNTARIRMLFVESNARGLGLGKQLVQNCINFAREKGFKEVVLTTHSILTPARKLYKAAGFTLLGKDEPVKFGPPDATAECWHLGL
ncbi:hypothetical protein QQS21_001398 [Conoideocrella luteorostrata]|uniref:N-acetyltransferase domain-containing protein n=1 Tax=Conoideocrella luteorostrata TaxID=1105319 RepID=A0AAJ0CXD9_9HYPO|nr:hypothetical protein QQS21_001398 [Conoideocrella luteorostrata]